MSELQEIAHALARKGCDPTKPLVPQIEALIHQLYVADTLLEEYKRAIDRLKDDLTIAEARRIEWQRDSYLKEKISNGALIERDNAKSALASTLARIAQLEKSIRDNHVVG